MTYCVGMLVREGLVMIADTRTNAGLDNVSSYRKLHVFETPGDRVIVVATSGNLSLTQTVLTEAEEGILDRETGRIERISQTSDMWRVAELLGEVVRKVRGELGPAMRAEGISTEVGFLIGGQIADHPMRLFMVYSAGNFIECGEDKPFLQIGEYKYGKPILDRALNFDSDLDEALKIGLISVNGAIRSNLSVGLPLDVIVVPRDAIAASTKVRIAVDDPYFAELGERWSTGLLAVLNDLPKPTYGSPAAASASGMSRASRSETSD
jgi:putative proteasome-type protease